MSRSGFYRWRMRNGTPSDKKLEKVLRLIKECHDKHPSHGYRWVHAYLSKNKKNFSVSADYVRRCFNYLGISAQTKHRSKARIVKRDIKDPYPNLIFSTWETIDRPRQVIVSDMTALRLSWRLYIEIVFYFDALTKQIIGCGLGDGKGGSEHYYFGLHQAITNIKKSREEAVGKLERGCGELTVFHTDQGSVYTSIKYNKIIKEAGIVRSCSRAGKPTDNPVNESLNGWIKEELLVDFKIASAQNFKEATEIIERYVSWYNKKRPCWSLGYKTPNDFYESFKEGKIKCKDTFRNRELNSMPKFLQKKLAKAEEAARANGGVGSSDPVLFDLHVSNVS